MTLSTNIEILIVVNIRISTHSRQKMCLYEGSWSHCFVLGDAMKLISGQNLFKKNILRIFTSTTNKNRRIYDIVCSYLRQNQLEQTAIKDNIITQTRINTQFQSMPMHSSLILLKKVAGNSSLSLYFYFPIHNEQ